MKRFFLFLSIAAACLPAAAQVTIPFDVPMPTWKGLLTSNIENGAIVFKQANASSDNLISVESGEETKYRWKAPSMYLEANESKFTIEPWIQLPYISTDGAWAQVEVVADNGVFMGWSVTSDLRQVQLFNLTEKDLMNNYEALAWTQDDAIYVIVLGDGYAGWTEFCVGKLQNGYVVCPYSCIIEWSDSNHPGILNGKLGSDGPNLSKFILKDVEFILANAQERSDEILVMYGSINNDGSREIRKTNTTLIESLPPVDDNKIYTQVEENPTYPGGEAALYSKLAQNLRYPRSAVESGIQGRVIVTFVVEKDGSITNPKVTRSPYYGFDEEAIRVVKTLGKMSSPGKINGRAVRSSYSLPVVFRLVSDEK